MKEHREKIQYILNTEQIYIDKVYKLEKLIERAQINFYEYMDDHYTRVSDGFVTEIGSSRPIIPIEQALEEYNRVGI